MVEQRCAADPPLAALSVCTPASCVRSPHLRRPPQLPPHPQHTHTHAPSLDRQPPLPPQVCRLRGEGGFVQGGGGRGRGAIPAPTPSGSAVGASTSVVGALVTHLELGGQPLTISSACNLETQVKAGGDQDGSDDSERIPKKKHAKFRKIVQIFRSFAFFFFGEKKNQLLA